MKTRPGSTLVLAPLFLLAPALSAQGDWVRTAILSPEEGYTPSDRHFGWDVSLLDDWALVAAPPVEGGRSDGRAHLYQAWGTQWLLDCELFVPGGRALDDFARSIALASGRALIGAPGEAGGAGAAHLFERGTAWNPVLRFAAPGGVEGDELGAAVALVGDAALVGAPGGDAVHVLEKLGGEWRATAVLRPGSDSSGRADFGRALAFDGVRAIVGAPEEGAVHVFRRDGGAWNEEARLRAPAGNEAERFGRSVALDGTTVVVGAPHDEGGGRAFVFGRSGSSWIPDGELAGQALSPEHAFGSSVSVSGRVLVVGAPGEGEDLGTVHVFERGAAGWQGVERFEADPLPGEGSFGHHVAVRGGMILGSIGLNETGTIAYAGAIYVWTREELAPRGPVRGADAIGPGR